MLKVGITGGIGSGKSTACKIFARLGISIFEADIEAKKILNNNPEIKAELIDAFGNEVFFEDKTLNRKYLAGIVFNDKKSLEKLNSIVHPAVRTAFKNWLEKQKSPYIVYEAAILFESGFYKMMDKNITVVTDESERIERVMKRDNMSLELVKQRINNQWTDEQRKKLADFVIGNNNNELIVPQIVDIDKKLRAYG